MREPTANAQPLLPSASATASTSTPAKRRGVLIGLGAAGAAAVAIKALPGSAVESAAPAAAAAKVIDTAGGYQETAHVLQYYQTARS